MSRNYSNTAVETTLSSGVTAGATSLTVGGTTGFPSPNFTLVLDPGTPSEELVLVTSVAGTTLTVTRGFDGTTGVSHSAGAVVQHAHSAKDFADSRAHEVATAAHGATGAVVGTTNTQTLSNKTIDGASNTVTNVAHEGQAGTAVTNGANVNAAGTLIYRRGGLCLLNVNFTTSAPIAAGVTLLTLPSGRRPGATIYGEVLDSTGNVIVRVGISPDGSMVAADYAIPSGRIVRGQVVYPL